MYDRWTSHLNDHVSLPSGSYVHGVDKVSVFFLVGGLIITDTYGFPTLLVIQGEVRETRKNKTFVGEGGNGAGLYGRVGLYGRTD